MVDNCKFSWWQSLTLLINQHNTTVHVVTLNSLTILKLFDSLLSLNVLQYVTGYTHNKYSNTRYNNILIYCMFMLILSNRAIIFTDVFYSVWHMCSCGILSFAKHPADEGNSCLDNLHR